jgi:hypothetical protein
MSEMKLIMEGWREFLQEQNPPNPPAPPQSMRDKAIGMLGNVRNKLAKGFDKMDATLQQDYCEKKFPELLSRQGDLETWGDLLATLNCGIQYKNRKAFFDVLTGEIPGLSSAKKIFARANSSADFILKMYQVDDEERPGGNISKLDMDDHVARMLDGDVEKEFIKFIIAAIGKKAPGEPIDPDWDITAELEEYLRDNNKGRTVDMPDNI